MGTVSDKQHFHGTETFGAIHDDVSVWEAVLCLCRGWSQRRQLLRHVLKKHWNMVVPPENTTLQDGYAWIFLEPNIQTSHTFITTENGICKSVGLTVTSACTLACVSVNSCHQLACHRHGGWATPYMARANSSLQPIVIKRSYAIPSHTPPRSKTIGRQAAQDVHRSEILVVRSAVATKPKLRQ